MSHSIFPSFKGNWGSDCNSGTHSATTVDLTWKLKWVFLWHRKCHNRNIQSWRIWDLSMALQTETGVGVRSTLESHWEMPLLRHSGVFLTFLKNSAVPVDIKCFLSKDTAVFMHMMIFLMGGRGWRVFAGWTHSSMERVVKYLDEQTGIRESLCSERWIEVGTGPWAALGAQLSSPGCGQHLLSWSMPAQGFALPFPFPWLRFVPADRNCREWHRWKAKGCFIFLWHSL